MRLILLCLMSLIFVLPIGAQDDVPAPSGEIAFVSNREEGVYQIYLMKADGSNVRQLTDGNADSYRPVWSPDGQHIAFMRKIEELEDSERVLTALWVMDADGENAIEIARDEGENFILDISIRMSWSPNGERLLYKRRIAGKTDLEMTLVNVDGTESSVVDVPVQEIDQTYFLTNETLIITYANSIQSNMALYDIPSATITFQAPFSPARRMKPSLDGTQIAFTEDQQLIVMDLSTQEERLVRETLPGLLPDEVGKGIGQLIWSGDGSRLAGILRVAVPDDPNSDMKPWRDLIFAVNLDGTEYVALAVDGHELHVTLSPDGEYMAFPTWDEGGSLQIAIARADGTEPKMFITSEGENLTPAWRPIP